jgi:hypothetical protein
LRIEAVTAGDESSTVSLDYIFQHSLNINSFSTFDTDHFVSNTEHLDVHQRESVRGMYAGFSSAGCPLEKTLSKVRLRPNILSANSTSETAVLLLSLAFGGWVAGSHAMIHIF